LLFILLCIHKYHRADNQVPYKWIQVLRKRIALAFPVFKIERLAFVTPTVSESSFNEIVLVIIVISRFTINAHSN